MRVAALGLGIIGGIIGLFAGGYTLIYFEMGSNYGVPYDSTMVRLGWAALGLSVLGEIGAALAMAKPRAAALMMLLAGIGLSAGMSEFILIAVPYSAAGPLLMVGALLSFLGKKPPTATAPVT